MNNDPDDPALFPKTQFIPSGNDASATDSLRIGPDDTPPDLPASRVVGAYKLLQRIGEGGMGEVWMAEQDKPVRRRVALKLIKTGLDKKQIVARFEAERQALAMMNHQNIAKVLDAGATTDGSPYFVMELVQGIPLNRYCDQNKLAITERLGLFIPICRAVQHAHQKGIIHRDLKPSNVLVCLYDGNPVPKVIDFGLAKALQNEMRLTDNTMFTEYGQVVGTLQYMSPEQAEMNQLDIDTRTDIYSLGVMLYELLTGSTPIDSETLRQHPVLQVLATIREKEPPRPSARLSSTGAEAVSGISQQRRIEPAKLKHILRGELDWIVMKALEKDRTRRYETANSFANDIDNYLKGDIVAARPPSIVYQFQKTFRRYRTAFLVATTIIVLLISGTAGTAYQAIRARKSQVRAQASEKVAREEAARAEQAVAALDDRRREAEAARNEAILQKQEAIAQRDRARQLMDFQTAEYALREGDLREAFSRLTAADGYHSNWEYGGIFGQIVSRSRENFTPVARWSIAPEPLNGCFVIPKAPDSLRDGLGWVVLAYRNMIRVHDMRTGQLVSERAFTPIANSNVGDRKQPSPVVVPVSPRMVNNVCRIAALSSDGLKLLDVPSLEVNVKVPDHLPWLVQAADEVATIATVDAQNRLRVIDTETGLIFAEHQASEVDSIAEIGISPDGNSIVYASFSLSYYPMLWTWKMDSVERLPSGSQTNTFVSNDTVLAVKSLSSEGNDSELTLCKVANGKIVSRAPMVYTRSLRSGVFAWTSLARINRCESNRGTLVIESVLAGSMDSEVDYATLDNVFGGKTSMPSRIAISHSASSLLPSPPSPQGTRPVFTAVDRSTLAVAVQQGEFLELFAPQAPLISMIDGVTSSGTLGKDLGTFSVGCFLWTMVHRDQKLITALNARSLAVYDLGDDGRPSAAGEFTLVPPEDLVGSGQAIVAVDMSKDGRTVWVLWEGADTFLHTSESKSRDLVVAIYDLLPASTLDAGSTPSSPRYSDIFLRKTFRLSRHKTGGARVLRGFFVHDDEKTLVVANENLTAGYSAESGRLLYEIPQTHKIAFSPDRKFLAYGSWRDSSPVTVIDIKQGHSILKTDHKQKVIRMAFSPNSDSVWIGWDGGVVEQIELSSGSAKRSFQSMAAPVVILPEGDRYVGFVPVQGAVGDYVLAEFDTGRKVSTLMPDSHILMSCGSDARGSCLTFTSKQSVEIVNRFNSQQAIEALRRIDPSHEQLWRSRLADFYQAQIDKGGSQ